MTLKIYTQLVVWGACTRPVQCSSGCEPRCHLQALSTVDQTFLTTSLSILHSTRKSGPDLNSHLTQEGEMRLSIVKYAPHEAHINPSDFLLFLTWMHSKWSIFDSFEPYSATLSQIRVEVRTKLTFQWYFGDKNVNNRDNLPFLLFLLCILFDWEFHLMFVGVIQLCTVTVNLRWTLL
jgi:hypothetical protein